MLLNRIASTFRRLRTEETGAGMAAVIGLLAVSLLTTSLVASSVVTATEYTTVTRAGVQSQAAAEAGIADARAGLIAGTCAAKGNNYSSAAGAVPRYVATVWVPSGASWVRGCPPGTATQVRILSTGYAQATGVAGASGRDIANIEVVLSSASVPTQITATGPAIYAYRSAGFGGGGRLLSPDGSKPDVMIREGDVNCTGGANGQVDMVVNNGNLRVGEGCGITGNVWASGRVTMPGGPNVGGNVVANAVTITGGSKVLGSVWSTTDVTLDGGVSIGGNVTAGSMSFTNGGSIGGNAQVSGHVAWSGGGPEVKGNLTANSMTAGSSGDVRGNAWIYNQLSINWTTKFYKATTVKSLLMPGGSPPNADSWKYNRRDFFPTQDPTIVPGGPTTSPYLSNPAAPAKPFVPNWVDFSYKASDWTGFATVTLTSSGTCGYTQILAAVQSFAGQPGVINALGCVGGVLLDSDFNVPVNADLAIFSNKFALTAGAQFSATTVQRLWLITPDNVADGLTTCTSGDDSFKVDGGFKISSNLRVMAYTPCWYKGVSGIAFTGQIFAGQVTVNDAAQLTYTAVGLPGVNLDTGVATTSASTEVDRTIVSYRNVQAGN